jgi:hypothetical protein
MLFGIASAPSAARVPSNPAVQPVAVLTVLSGGVLMRAPGADFIAAIDGAVLYVGTVLRTSADARALITLFEGSTIELDAASDITIDAATAQGGSTFADAFGRGLRVVMQLTTADSRYEPTTPAATASVRGIDFDVEVASNAGAFSWTLVLTPERVTTRAVAPIGAQVLAPAQRTSARAGTAEGFTARVTSKSGKKALAEALVLRLSTTGRSRDGGDRDREDDD